MNRKTHNSEMGLECSKDTMACSQSWTILHGLGTLETWDKWWHAPHRTCPLGAIALLGTVSKTALWVWAFVSSIIFSKYHGQCFWKASLEGRLMVVFCMKVHLFELNFGVLWILFHCCDSFIHYRRSRAKVKSLLIISFLSPAPAYLSGVI